MQVTVSSQAVRARALSMTKEIVVECRLGWSSLIVAVRARALSMTKEVNERRPSLDFIALALYGKKFGFGLVIKTFDERVVAVRCSSSDGCLLKQSLQEFRMSVSTISYFMNCS